MKDTCTDRSSPRSPKRGTCFFIKVQHLSEKVLSKVNSHGLVAHWFTGESLRSLPSHLNGRQLWKDKLLLSKSNRQSHACYKIIFSAPEQISVSANIALKCISFKCTSKQPTGTPSAWNKMTPPEWRLTNLLLPIACPFTLLSSLSEHSGMLLHWWHFYI